jgi:hypothetical protein
MAKEQLIDYIKKARASAMSDDQIKQEVAKSGWKTSDLEEAFKAVDGAVGPVSSGAKKPKISLIKAILLTILTMMVIGGGVFGFYALEKRFGPEGPINPKITEGQDQSQQSEGMNATGTGSGTGLTSSTEEFQGDMSVELYKDALIHSYVVQLRDAAAVFRYTTTSKSYLGLEKDNDYIDLCEKISDVSYGERSSRCLTQITDQSFCVKADLISQSGKYWCADDYGYQGEVDDQYCTAEKPYCDDLPSLPKGYTLKKFAEQRIFLETSCKKHSDCKLPSEYATRSSCPFVSLCLDQHCNVICPAQEN